ncbi:MAG: SMC-Scp complex subunit ScpB [Ignavibacteriales bacterium]|nr:SMC-Scp complex subunit ScpB [Ignavibacteriales bacterium]
MEAIYKSIIEALIFASDEPIKPIEIIRVVQGIDGDEIEITPEDIDNCVNEINAALENERHSINIVRIADGYIFSTRQEYAKYLGYLSSEKSKRRLSQAALETLAIVAYKQPITKPELESIRGVNSDYTINTLLEKNLIAIAGRSETVGRPILYATTDEFLKYFGLNKISDLPKPREIEEIMQDEDFLEQKRKLLMSAVEEQMEAELEIEGENAPEA